MFFLHISFYLAVPDHPGCHLSRLFGPLPRHCFKFKMLSDLQSFVYIYIYLFIYSHKDYIYKDYTHRDTHSLETVQGHTCSSKQKKIHRAMRVLDMPLFRCG